MLVTILKPQGYCSGVKKAIDLALEVKTNNIDKDVYILGMLVHNEQVIDFLNKKNIKTIFSEDKVAAIKALNEGDVLIFTAHGHELFLDDLAKEKGLIIYDAICPKVRQNLTFINDEIIAGHEVIYIGKKGHPEAKSALSISKNVFLYNKGDVFDYSKIKDNSPLVINQTTLNILELKEIHQDIKANIPQARFKDEICFATRQRQEAIKELPEDVDALLIVGDKRSSNTLKLYEIAKKYHPNIYVKHVQNLEELELDELKNKNHVAIGSGASTPSDMIDEFANILRNI